METIQFNTLIERGIIKIPKKFHSLNRAKAKVIILPEEKFVNTESHHSNANEEDFFEICGIWQGREIDKYILRKKAWRPLW